MTATAVIDGTVYTVGTPGMVAALDRRNARRRDDGARSIARNVATYGHFCASSTMAPCPECKR